MSPLTLTLAIVIFHLILLRAAEVYKIGTCYGMRSCLGEPTGTVKGTGNDKLAIGVNCNTFRNADAGGRVCRGSCDAQTCQLLNKVGECLCCDWTNFCP